MGRILTEGFNTEDAIIFQMCFRLIIIVLLNVVGVWYAAFTQLIASVILLTYLGYLNLVVVIFIECIHECFLDTRQRRL